MKYLREWQRDPNAVTANGIPVTTEIAKLLEPFINDCLSYAPNKTLAEWWSDGVVYLELTHHTATPSFGLLGITWIGSLGVAPFEIDVEIATDDKAFAKCRFRLGTFDERGQPRCIDPGRNSYHHILNIRPKRSRDWVVAIELTPEAPAQTDVGIE